MYQADGNHLYVCNTTALPAMNRSATRNFGLLGLPPNSIANNTSELRKLEMLYFCHGNWVNLAKMVNPTNPPRVFVVTMMSTSSGQVAFR